MCPNHQTTRWPILYFQYCWTVPLRLHSIHYIMSFKIKVKKGGQKRESSKVKKKKNEEKHFSSLQITNIKTQNMKKQHTSSLSKPENDMEMETEKGSRWEIFHNREFRAQRLARAENRDGEQAICQSKQLKQRKKKKKWNYRKAGKHTLECEWFLELQRWLCEAHPESECQKQQPGLEMYWRQSVPVLTLNKAISTSLMRGCWIKRKQEEEVCKHLCGVSGHVCAWFSDRFVFSFQGKCNFCSAFLTNMIAPVINQSAGNKGALSANLHLKWNVKNSRAYRGLFQGFA